MSFVAMQRDAPLSSAFYTGVRGDHPVSLALLGLFDGELSVRCRIVLQELYHVCRCRRLCHLPLFLEEKTCTGVPIIYRSA